MAIERADERGHLAAATDASEAPLRILESSRDPADEHPTVAPATDVADEVADQAVEILDGVGRAQGSIECAGDAEALQGQRLGEPFAERGCRAGMRPLEPGGELRESPFGERRIGERIGVLEGATDARPHRLGEMLQDVARLVDLTAMDERGPAAVL